MEILEKTEDGVIALIDMDKLHDHEKIKEQYLEELIDQIRADNELKCPIIIDKYSYVVLDGHHRFFALKRLGCSKIPALVVDYYNPRIKLENWHPVIKNKREVKAVFKALGNSKFHVQSVENERVMKVMIGACQACLGFIVQNDHEEFFVAKSDDKTFEDAMNCIREGLKTEGFRKDMDYVGGEEEAEMLLKSKEASMVIIIPKMTKEQVVEHGTRGSPLPAKTTRHIIPGKRTYPVSLNLLKKSTEA